MFWNLLEAYCFWTSWQNIMVFMDKTTWHINPKPGLGIGLGISPRHIVGATTQDGLVPCISTQSV